MAPLKKKFAEKYLKKLPLELIGLLALFGGAIYLFAHIAHEVFSEKEEETDHNIFNFLSAHVISPHLTKVMKGLTYMASAELLQIGYGVLIVIYLIPKNYKRMIEIFVVGGSGLLVNLAMKYSFHRLRPPDPLIDPLKSFSFPSGHATSGFIFYGLLVYLVWKTNIPQRYKISAGVALVLFSILIGFSRIYLRVHYPSDVAAGFCIGFAWLLLLIWLMEHIKKKAHEEVKQEVVTQQQQNPVATSVENKLPG